MIKEDKCYRSRRPNSQMYETASLAAFDTMQYSFECILEGIGATCHSTIQPSELAHLMDETGAQVAEIYAEYVKDCKEDDV